MLEVATADLLELAESANKKSEALIPVLEALARCAGPAACSPVIEAVNPIGSAAELQVEVAFGHSYDIPEGTEASDRLFEDFQFIVKAAGRHITSQFFTREDLEQEGMFGLWLASRRFDPDVSPSFYSYAYSTVLGQMRRLLRDAGQMVRPPRRVYEGVGKVRGYLAKRELNLWQADATEIAGALGIDKEDVQDILQFMTQPRDLIFDTNAVGTAEGETSVASSFREGDFSDMITDNATLSDALAAFPAGRTKRVMLLYYGSDLSQQQIAKIVGISQVHVSRLIKKGINILRQHFDVPDSE